jgi:hypothetical protein
VSLLERGNHATSRSVLFGDALFRAAFVPRSELLKIAVGHSAHITPSLEAPRFSNHLSPHNHTEDAMVLHCENSADKPPCARFERKMMLLELGRSQAR